MTIKSLDAQITIVKKSDVKKTKEKHDAAVRSKAKTEEEYRSAHRQLKEIYANFEIEFKGFCDKAQDLEEDRIACVKEVMSQYAGLVTDCSEADRDTGHNVYEAFASWETAQELEAFVAEKGTGGSITCEHTLPHMFL